jgi:hypothetical protein
MTPLRVIAALFAVITVSQSASATEWGYCLAPSNVEHKIYFSAVFATSSEISSMDGSFDEALTQAGLRHDEVQCPRAGDENSIMAMFQDAISFNKKIGRRVIYVRWEPKT